VETVQRFDDVEYMSGRADLKKKSRGRLVLDKAEVRYCSEIDYWCAKTGSAQSPPLLEGSFRLPFSVVTKVASSIETDVASPRMRALFGVLAAQEKTEEFVYIETETKDDAEGLVFKVPQKLHLA